MNNRISFVADFGLGAATVSWLIADGLIASVVGKQGALAQYSSAWLIAVLTAAVSTLRLPLHQRDYATHPLDHRRNLYNERYLLLLTTGIAVLKIIGLTLSSAYYWTLNQDASKQKFSGQDETYTLAEQALSGCVTGLVFSAATDLIFLAITISKRPARHFADVGDFGPLHSPPADFNFPPFNPISVTRVTPLEQQAEQVVGL